MSLQWPTGYYLDAAAWAALDDRKQGFPLRQRLSNSSFSKLITASHDFSIAILEGKTDEAKSIMERRHRAPNPKPGFISRALWSYTLAGLFH